MGRKAKDRLTSKATLHQGAQHVRHGLPARPHGIRQGLLIWLLAEALLRAVVSHGRRHGNGTGLGLEPLEGMLKLRSGLHRMAAQALEPSRLDLQRAMDQIHLGAT